MVRASEVRATPARNVEDSRSVTGDSTVALHMAPAGTTRQRESSSVSNSPLAMVDTYASAARGALVQRNQRSVEFEERSAMFLEEEKEVELFVCKPLRPYRKRRKDRDSHSDGEMSSIRLRTSGRKRLLAPRGRKRRRLIPPKNAKTKKRMTQRRAMVQTLEGRIQMMGTKMEIRIRT